MSSSAKDVRRLSTVKVRPSSYIDKQNDNHKQIDLNPYDLIFLRGTYMQKGFVFADSQSLQQKEDNERISDKISHLQTSLSHTLDHFFPLAGRLAIEKHEDDNTISVYINCNSEGAEFVHATTEISVEDILSPTYVPQSLIDPLFPLNGVLNYEGQSYPLLSVQVTELLDGAIFIGCSANHSVCDGTSLWHFINSWSEISRSSGNHTPCPPPVFERWFIKETDCPIRLPFSYAEKFSAAREARNIKAPQLPEGFVERCFRFTKPSIAMLKAKALRETKQKKSISSLQALLAHVWTAVIRARVCLTDNHDESRRQILFALFMNNRTKLIPALPDSYFGNSLCWGDTLVSEGSLLDDEGFGFLASSLNEVVNSHSYEKNRSFVESWIEKPHIPSPGDDNGSTMGSMFLARSSQWFNMYGNDFGWGRPIAVKTGASGKAYGITTVSPGPVEGSVDIEIVLPVEVFKAMENDAEFTEAFST